MSATIKIETRFYVNSCPTPGCGITFALENEYDDRRRADGTSFYCPNGHQMSYGKSEADKLREQLALTQGRLTGAHNRIGELTDSRNAAERSARAQRAANTQLRKRVADGCVPAAGARSRTSLATWPDNTRSSQQLRGVARCRRAIN